MNKNFLKMTTILSSLVLLPAISMAKPSVEKGDGSFSATVGNDKDGSFKQVNVFTADSGEVISAGKDGAITTQDGGGISKGVSYNKGSGVKKEESIFIPDSSRGDARYAGKTVNVTKNGVEVEVDISGRKEIGVDKDITLTDKQAAGVEHHKKNEKVENKKAIVTK